MRLASYIADGRMAFGAVVAEGVITLGERLGSRYPGLRDALAADAVPEMKKAADAAKPDHAFEQIKWLPPIPNPEKILCAGINYRGHAAETGRDLPKQPSMFIRLTSTLVGHEGELIRPLVSQKFDFEGELAVVIGRAGRHIPVERALDHVAGYTCFVDGSVRDYQQFSVASGKNFPGTGPIGPWIVTSDEIPDPTRLTLVTRLNGEVMQKAATDLLIYSVPQIISFCSDFTSLAAGDIIATGTPEGVGHRRNPPVWMKPGDVLEVEISSVGTLRSRVVDERA
jgi:2-keto-4-pentenoate hydratase/2-oxohepta-3-ene-1,7-dioic acid hydratase in catechol pathway